MGNMPGHCSPTALNPRTNAARRSGVALLSRFHLKDTELRPLASRRPNFALATMTVAGRPVRMAVVHASAPMGTARAARRDQQLALLASVARGVTRRRDNSRGRLQYVAVVAYLPTPPRRDRLAQRCPRIRVSADLAVDAPLVGHSIDHHLVSDGIAVHDFSVVGPTGSDHLAVLTELGIP